MRDEWELDTVSKLLSHNNFAERPFAIAKAYLTCFPTQKLSTLATFSQAIANGSHRPAGTLGKSHKTKQCIRSPAGIAITSPPRLKEAVTKVCGVRRKHPGKMTALLRQIFVEHTLLADAVRKAKHETDKEKKAWLHHNKGVAFNINMEEPLA